MNPTSPRDQFEQVVLPFWLENGIDERHGGFFTCFDNRGLRRISTDKFTWSQGRFVWVLARAADLAARGMLSVDGDRLIELAVGGAQFLDRHAICGDGSTRFVVGADGGSPETPNQPGRSVYADWFTVMGMAELARVSGEKYWFERAAPVLERAAADHLAGTAPTPPYEVPAGHQAYGPRMILANTLLVVAQAAIALGAPGVEQEALRRAVDEVLIHRLADGTFTEMPGPDPATLVSRHRVPGHALEGLWVMLEALDVLGDQRDRAGLLNSVVAVCELGWDHEHGGLLRYTDADGPQMPRGTLAGTEYESLVTRTWSTKLWWVHSEAAAVTAIAAQRYGNAGAAAWFERIWDYTMATFPGGGDGAEWVQVRDRAGRPFDQVVALPVKDPFHISRNLMQLIELDAAR